MSRSLDDLTPDTRLKCLRFMDKCQRKGIKVMIIETLRTSSTQRAYWMQGRYPLEIVNFNRQQVGLWPLTEEENQKEITWTMSSRHFTGHAFDIALVKNGKPTWDLKTDINDNDIPDYDEIGLIGESVGLVWGGRFKDGKGNPRPDRPHFENTKEVA